MGKQTVKVISDSTCDLSESLVEQFGIEIVPLHVILGDKVYEDRINVTARQIYDWAEENSDAPKTAAIAPEELPGVYRRVLEQYQEIVIFSIASGMSATNASMHLAAAQLGVEDRVHVVDSANLSTGLGLLVLEAAEMARDGADGSAIVEQMERQKPLVRSSFVVDTLMYLYRGGRCSGLTALVGETLKLHPKISVVNGEMLAGKKYRGSIERVTLKYVREMEEELRRAQPKRVFITHSECPDESRRAVYAYLQSLHHFEEIYDTFAGGVVNCHCGPGTLGVFFLAGEEGRE